MTILPNISVEPLYNPGQILEINGWPCWRTQVGPFELELDIVLAGQTATGEQVGIASFVVMEQDQRFLAYMGKRVATAIAAAVPGGRLQLLTAETKGAHFVPWVWQPLFELCGDSLEPQVIILRKGTPKGYMGRPVRMEGREIPLPQASYRSITSTSPQQLTLAPRDVERLLQLKEEVTLVFVDDFIGQGGTIVGVSQLLAQLEITPLQFVAVVGTDGKLYVETLTREKIGVTLLPQPFPLILPTFRRVEVDQPWTVIT
jgi:hypothetical protein